MAFMQLQTSNGRWLEVESRQFNDLIPADLCGVPVGLILDGDYREIEIDDEGEGAESIRASVRDYFGGDAALITRVTLRIGWAARYSAPGYMDCTDWGGVYATEEEATKGAREMYGSDDDDEPDEDEEESETNEGDTAEPVG